MAVQLPLEIVDAILWKFWLCIAPDATHRLHDKEAIERLSQLRGVNRISCKRTRVAHAVHTLIAGRFPVLTQGFLYFTKNPMSTCELIAIARGRSLQLHRCAAAETSAIHCADEVCRTRSPYYGWYAGVHDYGPCFTTEQLYRFAALAIESNDDSTDRRFSCAIGLQRTL